MADRECKNRGRQRSRQDHGGNAGATHDLGCVMREDVRIVPRVVADDDGIAATCTQVRRKSGRCTQHDRAIHAIAAWAETTTQAGGAELKCPGESVFQLVQSLCVAGIELGHQLAKLLRGVRIGVFVYPSLGACQQVDDISIRNHRCLR